jgi:diguanylate cyclase (GGDEF)-like protein/putative nucleotidyltransferase with HDIG domain
LGKELDRARRFDRPFSLLFFDVDHFKHVNDTYGHGVGDAVLRQIGERARSLSRGGDTLGRFGGEEFVLLLPEANANEASAVAERIRAAIAARPMATEEVAEGILVSVSIGVATYLADGDEGKALLSQADEAMYLSKRLGRNQVRTAAEGRQVNANPELQLLLQEVERGATLERQGQSPEQIKEGYILKMISSLLFLVEQRDPSMSEHSQRVSTLATTIAQELTLAPSEVFKIGSAALLHDIGKVGLPDALLEKAGPLSPGERKRLKQHPQLGAQILQIHPFLYDLVPSVLHHHERWDGTGYPDHLTGELIPLASRIIAIAESYDTMLRGLPYQVSHSPEEARAELLRGAGTQFDPRIVQCFLLVLTRQQEPQSQLQVIG